MRKSMFASLHLCVELVYQQQPALWLNNSSIPYRFMVKHFFIKIALFLWIACIPFEIRGFSYEYIPDGYFTSVHVLTVDPKEHLILPVEASGEDIARETVAALAKSYNATAAVNGGFWKANGNPAGILKINCLWYGTPTKPRVQSAGRGMGKEY